MKPHSRALQSTTKDTKVDKQNIMATKMGRNSPHAITLIPNPKEMLNEWTLSVGQDSSAFRLKKQNA